MGKLDLKTPFPRPCTSAEYFEDKARAIQDLAIPGAFEIALLDRRHRSVDHGDANFVLFDDRRVAFNLSDAEQCRRPDTVHLYGIGMTNNEVYGCGKPDRFFQTGVGVSRR